AAALGASVPLEAATVAGRHTGLCLVAPLVAGAQRARPHGEDDAAGLRKALRQTAAERCHGRGGDLRSAYRANMRFVATKRPTETMKRLGPQNRVRLLREGGRELCPEGRQRCARTHSSTLGCF